MGANIIDARMMPEREKVKDAASRQRQRRRRRQRRQQQNQNSVNTSASRYSTDTHNDSLDSNTDNNLDSEFARKQPLQMFLDDLLNERRAFSRTNRSLITSFIEEEEEEEDDDDEEDVGSSRSESSSSSSSSEKTSRQYRQPDEQKSIIVSPVSWKLVSDTARIPHRGLQSRQFMPPLTSSSPSSPSLASRGYDDKVDDRWSPSISTTKSDKNDDRSSSASMPAIPYRRRDHEFDHELEVCRHESEDGHEHTPSRSSLTDDISVVEATASATSKQQMSRQKLPQHQQHQQQQGEDETAVDHKIVPIRSYSFDHILSFPVVGVLNDHHHCYRHHFDDIRSMRLATSSKTLDAASTKSVEVFRLNSKTTTTTTTTTGTNKIHLMKTRNNINDNNNNNNKTTERISSSSRELLERSVLIASKSM